MVNSKQNIICLYLDDSIYLNTLITDDSISDIWNIKQLEINLYKLSELVKITNSKVYLISSLAVELIFRDGRILLVNTESAGYVLEEYANYFCDLMNKYFKGSILKLSNEYDSEKMIKSLDNGINRLVIFDDYNLTKYQNKNVLYFETLGSLDNNSLIKDAMFFLRNNAKIFSCDEASEFKPYCSKTILIRVFDSYHYKLDNYPNFNAYPELKYEDDFYEVINLYFDDVDSNNWKNMDDFKNMCITDDEVAFTKDIAFNLLENIYKITDGNLKDFDLVVHCRTGENISPAIFIILNDIFDLGYEDLMVKYTKYNKQVLDDILSVYIDFYSNTN